MKKEMILISHGAGGKHTYELINKFILKNFSNNVLEKMLDSAVLNIPAGTKIAFTTDSYTITPLFFPSSDIGKLSICGTINDLLCVGAEPKFISLSLIIEEGLETEILEKILHSIKKIAEEENVLVVTGDTKVVNKGSCDKIFINTAGIGVIVNNIEIGYEKIQPTDVVIVTGNIAEHGLAVLLSRGSYGFEYKIESDCASLKSLIMPIFLDSRLAKNIKFLRDPTRGGVASVLNEIVIKRKDVGIVIDEGKLPIDVNVKNICELIGIEPLNVANEGKMVIIVSKDVANDVIEILKKHPLGKNAKIIGEVTEENKGFVILKTIYGTKRIVDMPTAEELPRIC